MTCAVLSIGTELTRGELVNSNASWLGAELTAIGFEVVEHIAVDDNRARIISALERLVERTRVVVATGGLGPTTDDVTTEAVASALGVRLVRDDASLEHIRRRFERVGRTMTPSNAKQADFPEGADILPNPAGTAPGFGVRFRECALYFLPGVPREMKTDCSKSRSRPRIRPLAPNNLFQSHLRTFGLPESVVGEKLAGIEQGFVGTTIGYRAHFPEIEVKVLARGVSLAAARDVCERATAEGCGRAWAPTCSAKPRTPSRGMVGRALRARGWTWPSPSRAPGASSGTC